MHWFLLGLGILTLAIYVKTCADIAIEGRRIVRLDRLEPIDAAAAPRVSAIIPACNEERHIESALTSVLAQQYPDLEVIAINDRSTDATGAILDRIAMTNPRLKAVHIRELPPGWLGKNHALQYGADRSSGEWLLFTDADVIMDPTTIARAVRFAVERPVDHLAVPPKAVVGGFLSKIFLGGFALLFTMHTKPWKVSDPDASAHIGIGAFNLVRASAYRAVGGHAPIAMRPDDDLKLGKILKQRRFRQEIAFGTRLMRVEWYGSFGEMREGLMKNMFSVVNYNLALALLGCLAQFLLFVWPVLAVWITNGVVRWVNVAALIALLIAAALNSGIVGIAWWWGFTIPLAALISIYLGSRAAFLTLWNDGIRWRGTRYPLEELRRNRV
jgi:glycosyltransferase involved in cell wall biosynthesis